ncbi:MAG: RDD family protein, partial [Mycobacteriales bacterium]
MSAQLVTGEAVALDLRPAALPSRVLAGVVDALAQGLVLLVVGALATAVSFTVSSAAADALGILLIVLVLIVYPVTFETLLRGRTPGKSAMGLRVVRDDGGPIGFRQALVRGLAGAFLERPGVTLFTAGVATSLLNPQGKRLGDLLAGTVVVRERVPGREGPAASMPPPLAGWAAQLDLTGLSDDLALSVRQFVGRAHQLTPTAREDLGKRLTAAVTAAVGPPPPGTPGWAVLSAVLAERRHREEQRLAVRPGQEQRPPAEPAFPVPPPAPPAAAPATPPTRPAASSPPPEVGCPGPPQDPPHT